MNPDDIRRILRDFCEEADRLRPSSRTLRIVATSAGLMLAVGACEDEVVDLYGAPFDSGTQYDDYETDCSDQIDNDGDNLFDCDDDDCIDDIACQADLYRAPPAR